ncbi:MAG: restriction endonuclease subunit S [Burkholderiales bacterium]|nr:restriction endonuclease subunit S [Burkholderiales bacterium]
MNIETLAAKYSAIPSHWKLSTLGESLAGIIGGGTPSRDNPSFWGGDIPWLTVKDMRGRRPTDAQEHITQQAVKESATNIIPPDTVITAARVGLGKVVRVPFAAAINQDLKALVVGPDLDKSYLEYWLLSIATFLESIGSGTTVKGIRLETLRQLPIPLAPLQEQRKIVAELEKQFSRLDEAVANLQRVKANLKRYKASVLKAAVEGRLVETEATLARREGRTYETGEQLLQRILEGRKAKWAGRGKWKAPESPTADAALPDGWTWASVDQLADVGTGATPKRDKAAYWNDGDVPWVTSSVVNVGYVDQASEFVTKLALAETNLTLYPIGTLLIAMYGEGKTRGKCTELRIPASTNQALAALQVDSFIRGYLRHFLELNYEEMRKFASGGVQPNLNLSLVRAVCVPLPPLSEQVRIVAEVDRHLSIIREVEAEVDANLQRAQALRQSTLAKAFSSSSPEHRN